MIEEMHMRLTIIGERMTTLDVSTHSALCEE